MLVWQEAIELSEAQRSSMLSERRVFLRRLRPLLKQRWELHRLINGNVLGQQSTGNSSARAKVRLRRK